MAELRDVTEADYNLFFDILKENAEWVRRKGHPAWPEEHLTNVKEYYKNKKSCLKICYVEDKPAGTVIFDETDFDIWGPAGLDGKAVYVHKLCVREPFMKKGLSLELLDKARKYAVENGKEYLRLDCQSFNLKVKGIYLAFGFQLVGSKDFGNYKASLLEMKI